MRPDSAEAVLGPAELERDGPYRTLVQQGPDAIVLVALDGSILFASDRCRDLLGYEPDELIGQRVEVLVPGRSAEHREQRERYQQSPTRRPMGQRPVLSARHRSGASVPVDIALNPIQIGDATVTQAVIRDAMPRWKVEQDLLVQSVAMDAAANGIVITDLNGIIEWVNPAVTRMTGYSPDELIGEHTRILKSGHHDAAFYRELWKTVSAGETWFGSIVNRRKDGSTYHEEQHIAPVFGDDGQTTHYIAIKQDVTTRVRAVHELQEAHEELKRRLDQIQALHEQLREQAVRDPLTNLFNRRYLEETLRREIARAKRDEIELCAVAIDIDEFKPLNDTLGHDAGDKILVLLAELLIKTTRESDVVCRMGGDELLVIFPGAPLSVAQDRAALWLRRFVADQDRLWDGETALRCTLSVGLTMLEGADDTAQNLLKRADEALYGAKRAGRNCVRIA